VIECIGCIKGLDIHFRTAQICVKQYNECPNNIFKNGNKRGCRPILSSEHTNTVTDFIDDNPSATVSEVTEHLMEQFSDLKFSRVTIYTFMTTRYNLSSIKADFQPVERYSSEKIQKWFEWVSHWEKTDMDFLKNCVFLDETHESLV
jgi:hypothetical protein